MVDVLHDMGVENFFQLGGPLGGSYSYFIARADKLGLIYEPRPHGFVSQASFPS